MWWPRRPPAWARLAACLAHLAAVSRGGPGAGQPGVEGLQQVDVPLDRWKRILVDGRVTELVHASHLDDLLSDAPDVARPPSLIYIHDSTQPDPPDAATLPAFSRSVEQGNFGDRERLFAGMYDAGVAPRRLWFHMTPERNMTHRFLRTSGETKLPKFVFLPRSCNGWTEWCDPGGAARVVGGECYVEQCSGWKVIEPDAAGAWVGRVKELMKQEGEPELWPEVRDMAEQAHWFRSRDTATTREHVELLQAPRSLPRFTKAGFKLVEIPKDLHEELVAHYLAQNSTASAPEGWNSWGQTGGPSVPGERDAHETQSTMVNVYGGKAGPALSQKVKQVMKPRLERWVGVELEETSLYGMREYTSPQYLRAHLDRPDVLVVSVTFSVFQEAFDHKRWPLEVVAFDGNTWRVDHPQGTMLYYESATVQHGKPGRLPDGGKHVGLFLHYRPKDWMQRGFVEFQQMRSGKAVRIVTDERPRHPKQEGWPEQYHKMQRDTSDYSDMLEGSYFSLGNICSDPVDRRDDAAVKLGKAEVDVALRWSTREDRGKALLDAAKNSDVTRVMEALEGGADVNYADDNFWTALHEAARAGSVEVVSILLEKGADPKRRNAGSESALDLASARSADGSAARQRLLELLGHSEL